MSISIPNADYTPQLTGYTGQGAFRFWCQKVLPIVYDDSLSYYELLNKVVNYLNNVIADVASVENNIEQLNNSYVSLQNFVNDTNSNIETEINVFETLVTTTVNELRDYMNHYFDNLDVQQEINHKLDAMALDGSLSELLKPVVADELSDEIPTIVTDWLDSNITPTAPLIDKSLLISDAGADARITGYEVRRLDSVSLNEAPYGLPAFMFERGSLNNGISEDYKTGSRIRSKDRVKFNFDIIVGCKTGSYQIHYYDDTTGEWTHSEWVSAGTNLMLRSGRQFKILYSPDVEADTSAEYDFISMVENIEYSTGGETECKSPYIAIFERGGLDSNGLSNYNWYNRARTANIVSLPNDIELYSEDGHFSVFFYDSNGAYIANTDWISGQTLKISAGENFKILISTDPNGNVATELKDIVDKLDIDVVDYSDELNAIEKFIYGVDKELIPANIMERGHIASGANDNYRYLSRIRSKAIQQFEYYVSVDCTSGSFVILYYNDDGTYLNNTGWIEAGHPRVIRPGLKFRVLYTPNKNATAKDYYNFADMVSNLRIVREMTTISVLSCSIDMERGNISGGIDDNYEHNIRARSVKAIKLPFPVKVKANYGQYMVFFYHDDGSYDTYATWRTNEELVLEPNRKFRVLVRYQDDTDDYRTLPELCGVLNVEPLGTSAGYNSTPNIEFACRYVHKYSVPPESVWYVKDAALNQYDRVRATVRVTTDGYLFNCHDATINNYVRNPDGSELSENVSANGRTLDELNQYDWGIQYGEQYRGAKAPMFEDLARFASLYNLNLTWHSGSAAAQTPDNVDKVIEICDKYGLTDNLIVVTSGGHYFEAMNRFKAHNKRISYYIGDEISWFFDENNIASINSLKTGLNKVYVQINRPWGSTATPEFIALAKSNDWELYDSTVETANSFFTEATFARGSSLIEVGGVTAVKSRVSAWVDSLVNTFLDS